MKNKNLKIFIIIHSLITILFAAIIYGIFSRMGTVVWWKTALAALSALILYIIFGAVNIVLYVKKLKIPPI